MRCASLLSVRSVASLFHNISKLTCTPAGTEGLCLDTAFSGRCYHPLREFGVSASGGPRRRRRSPTLFLRVAGNAQSLHRDNKCCTMRVKVLMLSGLYNSVVITSRKLPLWTSNDLINYHSTLVANLYFYNNLGTRRLLDVRTSMR